MSIAPLRRLDHAPGIHAVHRTGDEITLDEVERIAI
jgi:hypothetical protein